MAKSLFENEWGRVLVPIKTFNKYIKDIITFGEICDDCGDRFNF